MRIRRVISIILILLLLGSAAWGAVYVRKRGFTKTWRNLVTEEFAKRGFYVRMDKLTLDPFRGLTARDVVFYQEPDHKVELARISAATLDLDLSQVFDKEISLNTIDFKDADLSLPIDPKDKKAGRLELRRCSARILMPEQRIDIVNAQADVQGIRITVTGSLLKAQESPEDSDENKEDREQKRKEQLDLLRERRHLISEVLEQAGRLEFKAEDRPRVELEIHGDLSDLDTLRATMAISAGPLTHQGYRCEDLKAYVEYDPERKLISVREFVMRDTRGAFRLRADWPLERSQIEFDLESNLDLPRLIASIVPQSVLREVVFFNPPRVTLEGVWNLDQPVAPPSLPVQGVGRIATDRFVSQGEVFDSFETDFSVDGSRSYFRNVRLGHKTGVLLANALYDPEHFQYQSIIKMDPRAFLPFFNDEGMQHLVSSFNFDDESSIYVATEGGGPNLDVNTWKTTGEIDLRDFEFNSVPIDQLRMDFETNKRLQYFRDVRLVRPEGEVTTGLVFKDLDARKLIVENALSTIDPVAGCRCVNQELSDLVKPYRFEQPPVLGLSGVIDERSDGQLGGKPRNHNFIVTFESDYPAKYDFLGQTLDLERPRGLVKFFGDDLHLEQFQAGVLDGTLNASFHARDLKNTKQYNAIVSVDNLDFRELTGLYSDYQSSEGSLSGQVQMRGSLNDPRTINGNGLAKIQNGDVFAIPIFGPLSKLMSDVLPQPRAGYSVAREASMSFTMKDGVLKTDDFEALTRAFRLVGNGELGFVDNWIDFDAKIQIRGTAGVLLGPVGKMISKIFEFHASGKVSEPEWRPKHLPSIRDMSLPKLQGQGQPQIVPANPDNGDSE